MMKSEFENLAGRAVTDEQYRAIEILYMSSKETVRTENKAGGTQGKD